MANRGLIRLAPYLCLAIAVILLLVKMQNTLGRIPLAVDDKEPQAVDIPPFSHAYNESSRRVISSASSPNEAYFKIDFRPFNAINPNGIPHPTLDNTWIMVAQLDDHSVDKSVWFAELFCNAAFKGDSLACINPPLILSIGKTPNGDHCGGNLEVFSLSVGPHDARIFYGPSMPYAIFGSNSQHTCFGQWIQDFRVLVDWPYEKYDEKHFRVGTEIQRPLPYSPVEKNYFVFWDADGQVYAHYDILPKRVFAKLSHDGSIGPDIAPKAIQDSACLARHMPKIPPEDGGVHQATNSISITLCKRSECKPDDSNTFIFVIFHVKKTYGDDGYYDGYAMLFQQSAPFALHAISEKAFWVNGRGRPGQWTSKDGNLMDRAQMIYVTSVSWKNPGQRYHGYIDDTLFIFFGIEDNSAGMIDVVAGDLLADLVQCTSV